MNMNNEELYKASMEVAKKLIEKNPELREWVESKFPELKESEDERTRKWLIKVMKRLRGEAGEDAVYVDNAIAWLEKQGEQKATEWSKKDEEKLNTIIALTSSNPAENPFYDKRCLIEWLKSINPQNHWKPSRDQLKALGDAVANHPYVGSQDASRLSSLYNELKKL